MNGDIVFGLDEDVALKMVSSMMGGYASTMLFNHGVQVDIELNFKTNEMNNIN